ncbi:50S ribosomal protein L2 [Candidatus Peregrinibacteria bacterium]|nr:MAG: 50S ribosomal protein L2 [Candidatus Peregrinibacteria bacterium]
MPVRILKNSTSGQKASVVDYSILTRKKPEKSLCIKKVSGSGRNAHGHITVRHRGGGVKRKIRIIDSKRTDKAGIPARVTALEYDPGRTAFLALLCYNDGEKRYVIAPEGVSVGAEVICDKKAKIQTGNRIQIRNIPPGYPIHDVELKFGKGGELIKSAGSSGKITSQDGEMAQIELPSGEVRYISKECYATIGIVSNADHANVRIGKAGRKRKMGWRPQVLGKSMNPVDHPHGGGEGHSPIGLKAPKTPWGAPALGKKTRSPRKVSSRFIIRRRKKK